MKFLNPKTDIAFKKVFGNEKHTESDALLGKEGMIRVATEEGEKRGEKRGEKKKAIEIAGNLLKTGLNVKSIALATGLTINEIKELGKIK